MRNFGNFPVYTQSFESDTHSTMYKYNKMRRGSEEFIEVKMDNYKMLGDGRSI
jgi:hypothetical protein